MATLKKRGPSRRASSLGYGHIWQLVTGHDFARPSGFGDNLAAMRAAWPALRAKAFEMCNKRRQARGGCGRILPWGWWRFESKVRRDSRLDERRQLARMRINLEAVAAS